MPFPECFRHLFPGRWLLLKTVDVSVCFSSPKHVSVGSMQIKYVLVFSTTTPMNKIYPSSAWFRASVLDPTNFLFPIPKWHCSSTNCSSIVYNFCISTHLDHFFSDIFTLSGLPENEWIMQWALETSKKFEDFLESSQKRFHFQFSSSSFCDFFQLIFIFVLFFPLIS